MCLHITTLSVPMTVWWGYWDNLSRNSCGDHRVIIKTWLSLWMSKREKNCIRAKKCSYWRRDIEGRLGMEERGWLTIASSSTFARLNFTVPLLFDLLPSFPLSFMHDQLHNSHVHLSMCPCECRMHSHAVRLDLTNSRTQSNKVSQTWMEVFLSMANDVIFVLSVVINQYCSVKMIIDT